MCQPVVQRTLRDSICLLHHSYRFDDKSGIGQLAKAVNRRDWQGVRYLQQSPDQSLSFAAISEREMQQLVRDCAQAYQSYLALVSAQIDIRQVLSQFNRFQLLCAVRQGDYGVAGLNLRIERQLAAMGLIEPSQNFYPGKPIMISENDYDLELFNGDIAIVLPDEHSQQLKAWFVMADGSSKGVFVNRLPAHEAVYAMTVHKSQGSEFERVVLVLPPAEQISQPQLINKELIYTGITRAKKHFALYGPNSLLKQALMQNTARASGLTESLYRHNF